MHGLFVLRWAHDLCAMHAHVCLCAHCDCSQTAKHSRVHARAAGQWPARQVGVCTQDGCSRLHEAVLRRPANDDRYTMKVF